MNVQTKVRATNYVNEAARNLSAARDTLIYSKIPDERELLATLKEAERLAGLAVAEIARELAGREG